MKTKIAIIIVIVLFVCGLISAADLIDPNEPAITQIVRVRLLTAEESLALEVNGLTLSQLVNKLLERELPRQVNRAKDKLAKEWTLTQILEAKK